MSQVWQQVAALSAKGCLPCSLKHILAASVSQVRHQVTAISANSECFDLDEPQPNPAAGEPGVCHRPLPASPGVALSLDGFPPHGPDRPGCQQVCAARFPSGSIQFTAPHKPPVTNLLWGVLGTLPKPCGLCFLLAQGSTSLLTNMRRLLALDTTSSAATPCSGQNALACKAVQSM